MLNHKPILEARRQALPTLPDSPASKDGLLTQIMHSATAGNCCQSGALFRGGVFEKALDFLFRDQQVAQRPGRMQQSTGNEPAHALLGDAQNLSRFPHTERQPSGRRGEVLAGWIGHGLGLHGCHRKVVCSSFGSSHEQSRRILRTEQTLFDFSRAGRSQTAAKPPLQPHRPTAAPPCSSVHRSPLLFAPGKWRPQRLR
jgi:hypothetical protein